jgi:hypothetical protein
MLANEASVTNDIRVETPAAPVSKKLVWAGWVLTILPSLLLIFSAAMKLSQAQAAVEGFEHLGYPAGVGLAIGIAELACAVVYLIPRTAVLGAILLTGYLGGATTTHVRVEEPFIMPIVVGVVLWAGLYLRDDRLRALIPLRKERS